MNNRTVPACLTATMPRSAGRHAAIAADRWLYDGDSDAACSAAQACARALREAGPEWDALAVDISVWGLSLTE